MKIILFFTLFIFSNLALEKRHKKVQKHNVVVIKKDDDSKSALDNF